MYREQQKKTPLKSEAFFNYVLRTILVFFFFFKNSFWSHLLQNTKCNPVRKNESHQENQHPEGHPSDQKKQNNSENAHLCLTLVIITVVKILKYSNPQTKNGIQDRKRYNG